jgi:cyanophycin synthetase
MLRITSQLVIEEAKKRNWKTEVIDTNFNLLRYTSSEGKVYFVKSLMTEYTSAINVIIANRKNVLYTLAREWDIPVPETEHHTTMLAAKEFLHKYKTVVVKPEDGAHGNGVTTGISTEDLLEKAINHAHKFSKAVLLQKFVEGDDYRLLFIGGKLAAAAIRKPAEVTGDGIHTFQELIELENQNDERGVNYRKRLNLIDIFAAKLYLGDTIKSVPKNGEVVTVVGTANIGTGGYAIDVTETVPPILLKYATVLTQQLGLENGGVDFLYKDDNHVNLLEINANPSLGLHAYPFKGSPQPVASLFLDWLGSK